MRETWESSPWCWWCLGSSFLNGSYWYTWLHPEARLQKLPWASTCLLLLLRDHSPLSAFTLSHFPKRSYNISRLNETNFTHQRLLEQDFGDEHDAVECSCDGCRANRPCLMTGMRAKRPESVFLYEIWNDIQALKRTHRGVFLFILRNPEK